MAKIGIDFGTSYTTASYIDPSTNKATPIRINGKEKIPSIIYFPNDGSAPLIGDAADAKYDACMNAESSDEVENILSGIVTGIKRNMSVTSSISISGDNSISYPEAISLILKYVKEEAERTCFEGEKITDVCITYPVSFDETPIKKDILREAARLAGFKIVRLLMEPVAAAYGYAESRSCYNQGVLIYDFGGGTFDLAYVKFDHKGNHITLPPIGDANCGGENIDYDLYKEWNKIVRSTHNRDIAEFEGETFLPILKRDCVKQKEAMSKGIFEGIKLFLPPFEDLTIAKITRFTPEYWNSIVSPWIDRTIVLTQQMLNKIQQEKFKVDKVILIGGSSQIPLAYQRLSEICPVLPNEVQSVDVAVANGAAIFINEDYVELKQKKCFCMYCGYGKNDDYNTAMKFCPNCGKENFRYDYRLKDL